jgi:hypothetical protein
MKKVTHGVPVLTMLTNRRGTLYGAPHVRKPGAPRLCFFYIFWQFCFLFFLQIIPFFSFFYSMTVAHHARVDPEAEVAGARRVEVEAEINRG